MIGVLFVCTGNICRSPTAEGVFRARVVQAGLGQAITVDSAGTHGYHIGDPPDPRGVAAALRRGYDLASLRARQLAANDFAQFDLLLAMDRGHPRIMRELAPPGAEQRRGSSSTMRRARDRARCPIPITARSATSKPRWSRSNAGRAACLTRSAAPSAGR
jgi:protein-tyrosine phosphatase